MPHKGSRDEEEVMPSADVGVHEAEEEGVADGVPRRAFLQHVLALHAMPAPPLLPSDEILLTCCNSCQRTFAQL